MIEQYFSKRVVTCMYRLPLTPPASARAQSVRQDRSFLSSFFSLLLLFVCIARTGEPVSIRTGSTDLGPIFLFFFSREAECGGASLLHLTYFVVPGFVLLVYLLLSLLYVSFLLLCCFYPQSTVPLYFLSWFSSSSLLSLYLSMYILFPQLLYIILSRTIRL